MREVKSPLSYEEFLRVREDILDRTELIDGVLYLTPSPTVLHQLICLRLVRKFDQRFLHAGGGSVFFAPLDVRMGSRTVIQPDLVIVLDDRAHTPGGRSNDRESVHRRRNPVSVNEQA